MGNRLKVDLTLNRDDVEALEAFAAERSRTVDDLHEWVLAHGYTIHRSAVANWRTSFEARLMEERFTRSGELARAIRGAVDRGSLEDMAEGAATQLTQVVFEQAAALQAEGAVSPLDVRRWASSLRDLVGTKADAAELRKAQAAAVAEAERVAKAGGSGEAVAAKVRELLGIKEAA